MTVISVDGNDVEPVPIDTLIIATGERFDVIIKTDKIFGSYWILVKLVGTCKNQGVFQVIIFCHKKKLNISCCLLKYIFQNAILSYEEILKSNFIFPSSTPNYDGYPRSEV